MPQSEFVLFSDGQMGRVLHGDGGHVLQVRGEVLTIDDLVKGVARKGVRTFLHLNKITEMF